MNPDWDIRILASDIDTDVLSKASEGIYDADRLADVPLHIRQNYFTREKRSDDSSWTVKPTVRELITFRRINLQESPWQINTEFDIIFCRNVMIYFNAETQKTLVERFAEKLNPEGNLIIGHSESLFGISDRFKPLGETVYGFASPQSVPARSSVARERALHSAAAPAAPAGSAGSAGSGKTNSTKLTDKLTEGVRAASLGPKENLTRTSNIAMSNAAQAESSFVSVDPDQTAQDEKYSIIVGEYFASNKPIWIATVLGSCVATCLYDDVAQVGGMNHFMLPESRNLSNTCASFGVHAMEMLINEIMKRGGDRRRLKAKFFGGGAVVRSQASNWNIGEQNVAFARKFLETENIPIVAEHVGGTCGMRVQFHTKSAKVIVRPLDQQTTVTIELSQRQKAQELARQKIAFASATLF